MLSILRDYALSLTLVTLILVGYGAVVLNTKRPSEGRNAASVKTRSTGPSASALPVLMPAMEKAVEAAADRPN